MDKPMHEMDDNHGPQPAPGCRGRLQNAMEHARRVAGAQAAMRGVLDPDGAALWLRFCEEAGLGEGGRN
ncbi:hypothetical protein KDL44_10240 [bacterium]|nr:hypothetical protein [bacterium]